MNQISNSPSKGPVVDANTARRNTIGSVNRYVNTQIQRAIENRETKTVIEDPLFIELIDQYRAAGFTVEKGQAAYDRSPVYTIKW